MPFTIQPEPITSPLPVQTAAEPVFRARGLTKIYRWVGSRCHGKPRGVL